jgi:hypothetical protein
MPETLFTHQSSRVYQKSECFETGASWKNNHLAHDARRLISEEQAD